MRLQELLNKFTNGSPELTITPDKTGVIFFLFTIMPIWYKMVKIGQTKGGHNMVVCAHGDVFDYCRSRNMIPLSRYEGEIEDYSGVCPVLVTDMEFSDKEYYLMKSSMLAKGVELISTLHEDNEVISKFILESIEAKRGRKSGGRCKFGFQNISGEMRLTDKGRVVVARIFDLRDRGYPYHKIQEDELVRHPDGRKLAVSTIQIIIKNREVYEEEGV